MLVYTIVSNSSNSGVALRILGVALTVGEKGVALIVGETAASHLTPLHAPGSSSLSLQLYRSSSLPLYLKKATKKNR